jgi:diaminopimelate epimerase
MTDIDFFKMSGSGNDFVVIDNRARVVEAAGIDPAEFARRVCRRKLSVGADGLILVEESEGADFKWRFYNPDGSMPGMCGNGARCAARFARLKGIAGPAMTFQTGAGLIQAEVVGRGARVKLSPPSGLAVDLTIALEKGPVTLSRVDTGVPHAVIEVADVDEADVVTVGREVRYHRAFAPEGTNVNFVSRRGSGEPAIRTYERGVEDETLACGTGSAAAALVLAEKYALASPVRLRTRSGTHLTIHFRRQEATGRFTDVYLEGDARVIYRGVLGEDAWQQG